MRAIEILAATYTSKEMGEVDIKTLKKPVAWRYRQDIFPNPDDFGLKISGLEPELVETGDEIYPYRMKIMVLFNDSENSVRMGRYQEAVRRRVRRFDIVRSTADRESDNRKEPETVIEKTNEEPAKAEPASPEKAEAAKLPKPVKAKKSPGRPRKKKKE